MDNFKKRFLLMNERLNLRKLSLILLSLVVLLFFLDESIARRKTHSSHRRSSKGRKHSKHIAGFCSGKDSNTISTSIYYTPREKDFRSRSAFRRDVKLQGSGIQNDGRLLTYTGATKTLPPLCNTTVGASGNCLVPFFSVAADKRYHSPGDVIYIPEMAGVEVTVENKNGVVKFKHPGYFIVEDVGGAIKGANRFDIYTGNMRHTNPENAFGMAAKNPIANSSDKRSCNKHINSVDLKVANAFKSEIEKARQTLDVYMYVGLANFDREKDVTFDSGQGDFGNYVPSEGYNKYEGPEQLKTGSGAR